MTELAVPLIRTRRKRPRKPTFVEAVGLLFMTVGAVEVGMCSACLASGRFLDGKLAGHDWPHDAAFDYAMWAIGGFLALLMVALGLFCAWSWFKNPWKDEDD